MTDPQPRRQRADARRNLDTLLEAAKAVFAESGVDAPVREVAARAGVGVGTLYRHFPLRSDLVTAVFRREVDECAAEAPEFAASLPPVEALAAWLDRYTGFVAAKRGLAAALHSGDPAFEPLPAYFSAHLSPACHTLLDAAEADGSIRADVDAEDLLRAVSNLCMSSEPGPAGAERSRFMVGLLVDGLRFRATAPQPAD